MVYIRKSFQGVLNFGAKKELFEYARELRKTQTEAEVLLWENLRFRRCGGLKFRRQHPANHFILDFYCHEFLLAVEVDGSVHDSEEAKEYDANRTAELENYGITVVRFQNELVLDNINKVKEDILNTVEQIRNQQKLKI